MICQNQNQTFHDRLENNRLCGISKNIPTEKTDSVSLNDSCKDSLVTSGKHLAGGFMTLAKLSLTGI